MSYDIMYISMLMSDQLCAEMTERDCSFNMAAQVFHRLLAKGIAANPKCGSLKMLSALHCSRKKICFRASENDATGKFVYSGHVDLPAIRSITRILFTFAKLLALCVRKTGQTVMIVDPLLMFLLWPSVICAKLFRIPLFLVVTDLINFMDSSGGKCRQNWLKRLNIRYFTRLCGLADGYIVLTPQMCNIINPRHKPYLVMEGLIEQPDDTAVPAEAHRAHPRVIMYAGGLYKAYGVELLIRAFIKADMPDTELHLYGWGDMVPEVREICGRHSRIVFKGSVTHLEILEAERRAALLVNPRPGGQEFTKYSFPSKNLEYMASGTPLLAFMLPGIPEEYRDYFFIISSDDETALAAQLGEIMGKSREYLNAFGMEARRFAITRKNNMAQAERVISFIAETLRAENGR